MSSTLQRWTIRPPGAGRAIQRVAAAYGECKAPAGRIKIPSPPPCSAANWSRRACTRDSRGGAATQAAMPRQRRHSATAHSASAGALGRRTSRRSSGNPSAATAGGYNSPRVSHQATHPPCCPAARATRTGSKNGGVAVTPSTSWIAPGVNPPPGARASNSASPVEMQQASAPSRVCAVDRVRSRPLMEVTTRTATFPLFALS